MDFHGITMQGEKIEQSVATLPAWAADDEGRTIYVQDQDKMFFATDSQWVCIKDFETDIGGLNRPKFAYSTTSAITMTGGSYQLEGTYSRWVGWVSSLTFTFGSGGSNAGSDDLSGAKLHGREKRS